MPARVSMAATLNKPTRKEPVVSRRWPIQYGPKPLPRLPMALIKAMERAAAAAVKEPDAMAQNGPAIEDEAERAMAKQKTVSAIPGEKPLTTRAVPPANAESAMWRRRSPVRSECAPTRTMKIAAAR